MQIFCLQVLYKSEEMIFEWHVDWSSTHVVVAISYQSETTRIPNPKNKILLLNNVYICHLCWIQSPSIHSQKHKNTHHIQSHSFKDLHISLQCFKTCHQGKQRKLHISLQISHQAKERKDSGVGRKSPPNIAFSKILHEIIRMVVSSMGYLESCLANMSITKAMRN
jgi:hypothetical protein